MNLSSEDSLRLNVLITQAEAVRIDESRMVVYGLKGEQEMKVQLNPTCNGERYVANVREMLSSAVLDSPGGYPVFLRRWTRMGQIDNDQLDRLLRLGEPEAVMAVVCSPGLNDDLARRAWWAAPCAEHARRMLEHEQVCRGEMGRVLAEYLLEYLPFETEHRDMLDTVRLVLRPGLCDEEQRRRLWDAGRSKKTYRIGFLATTPEELPERSEPRHDYDRYQERLAALAESGNGPARLLRALLGSAGQSFIDTAVDAMKRPADQDVVAALLNAIGSYFAAARIDAPVEEFREIEAIGHLVEQACAAPEQESMRAVCGAVPELVEEIRAMLFLSYITEAVVTPIFSRSDAVGSVMRKKIEPVTGPILQRFAVLKGTAT